MDHVLQVKYEEAEKQNKPNEKSDSEEQSNHEKSTTDQEKQPDEPELKGSKATGRESQSSNPNESSEEKEVVDVSDVYKVRIGLAPLTDSSDDLYWHVQKVSYIQTIASLLLSRCPNIAVIFSYIQGFIYTTLENPGILTHALSIFSLQEGPSFGCPWKSQ